MKKASENLQFILSSTYFIQSAEKIIPPNIVYQIRNRISQLNDISQKLGNLNFTFDDDTFVIRTFRKFKSGMSSNSDSFSKRELRALIYGLDYSEGNAHSIFNNEIEVETFLNILILNWRDTYLDGLILFLFKNWESNSRNSLRLLSEFVTNKLKEYKGKRSTLISFKTNLKYFDLNNGDIILGKEMALRNIPVNESSSILSLADTWFTYPYFSRVIVAYYENKQNEFAYLIDNFDCALELHKNSNTNKRIISKFIIQANKPEYSVLQDKVKQLAFKFIGDPENKSVWADFYNSNDKEKLELLNARNILNQWITRQFINLFFNICINDERRRRFWLKYASVISSFKIYGPKRTKILLKQDDRISQYLDTRFQTVSSSIDVSACILYIRDFMLIEFSDAGYAFYAYKIDSQYRRDFNKNIYSVDIFRNSNMPMLIYRSGNYINRTNIEGRLTHNDGDLTWEEVFSFWLKNVAKIDI